MKDNSTDVRVCQVGLALQSTCSEKKRRRARPSRAAPSVHFTLDGLVWLCYPPASVLQGGGKQSEIEGERAARGGSPQAGGLAPPRSPQLGRRGREGRRGEGSDHHRTLWPACEAGWGPGAKPSGGYPTGGNAHQAGSSRPPPSETSEATTSPGGPTENRAEGPGGRPGGRAIRPPVPGAGPRTKSSRLGFQIGPPLGGPTTAVWTSTRHDRQARGSEAGHCTAEEPPPGQPGCPAADLAFRACVRWR